MIKETKSRIIVNEIDWKLTKKDLNCFKMYSEFF